jgi:hypothetical protein
MHLVFWFKEDGKNERMENGAPIFQLPIFQV